MEKPVSLKPEHIRDEKVKVCIRLFPSADLALVTWEEKQLRICMDACFYIFESLWFLKAYIGVPLSVYKLWILWNLEIISRW